MTHFYYLILDLVVGLGPIVLILAFRQKLTGRMVMAYLISFITIGSVFIISDMILVNNQIWSFNSDFTLGIKLGNLPIEEILFFLIIPFSCILIYELIKKTNVEVKFNYKPTLYLLMILLIITSYAAEAKIYTSFITILTALFLGVMLIVNKNNLASKNFWIYNLICLIPFLIIDLILTFLPIVSYNPAAILSIRIITIPIEDICYSFLMLSLYLVSYKFWLRLITNSSRINPPNSGKSD